MVGNNMSKCLVPTGFPGTATAEVWHLFFSFTFRVLLDQQDLEGALEDLDFGGER